jgi:flagellar hook-associated protein 2
MNINEMNNTMRLTGMATGMDTDDMVKKMLAGQKMKIDKVEQDKQIINWKQDSYRDVIKDLKSFQSKYFDQLNRDTYLLSDSTFSEFDVSSTNTSVATAKALTGAEDGVYTVTVGDNKLAQSAKISGAKLADGTTKSTKLTDLNSSNNKVFKMKITYGTESKEMTIDNTATGELTINDIISKVSEDTKGKVIAKFSELTGKFSFETKELGENSFIKIENVTGAESLASVLNITSLNPEDKGQNAEVKITPPGGSEVTVTKSSNAFTIDGIQYNLTQEGTTDINIKSDVDKTFDKFKGFIEDYNKMVDKIYKKVEEKKLYSYKPLTAEQKKGMKEDEIKTWEAKAKQGLLKGDNTLESMLSALRGSFFEAVEGAGINFTKKGLGLDTSSELSERGKIKIVDESKFKEALKNKGQQVMDLFIKNSEDQSKYSRVLSKDKRKIRYDQEGIFQRINDIINDYSSGMRDSNGRKASLIEKAGIENDSTYLNNMLTKQIVEKEKIIEDLNKKMYIKQESYYKMFAKLETAMNSMNAQSSWLNQQLGMGQ